MRAHPRSARWSRGVIPTSCGGSYTLGGGGSGERATDRGSFSRIAGSSRTGDGTAAGAVTATLIAFGEHDAAWLHVPGAHGNEQSGCGESPLPSLSDDNGIGMPAMSAIPAIEACVPSASAAPHA